MFFRNSRKKYLTREEYNKILNGGIEQATFIRFAFENWSISSVLMLFLHIKKAPREIALLGNEELEYKHDEFWRKIDVVRNICEKEKLIDVVQLGYIDTFIHIRYEGEKFIKFSPFWNSLLKEYTSLRVALTSGGFGAIATGLIWLYRTLLQ